MLQDGEQRRVKPIAAMQIASEDETAEYSETPTHNLARAFRCLLYFR